MITEAKNLVTASEAKRSILKLINLELTIYLTAMSNANPEIYKAFKDHITHIINDNNSIVNRQAHSKMMMKYSY